MTSEINTLKIVRYKNQSTLVMNGSFTSKQGNLGLKLIINGGNYDTKPLILPVKSGKGPVEHDFDLIRMNLPYDISDIYIEIVSGNNREKLTYLNHDEILKHTVSSSILYHIDSFVINENGIGNVNGWVFSLEKINKVNISVKNEKDTLCDSSIHRTLRQRVYESNLVARKDMLCGFILSFNAKHDESYHICFDDGITDISVSLDQFVTTLNKEDRIRQIFQKFNRRNIYKGIRYIRMNGFIDFLKRLKDPIHNVPDYNAWFIRNRVGKEELSVQRERVFSYAPKISILVPAFNTPEKLLREMIESVLQQSYSNWQLCIADASAEGNKASEIIDEYCDKDARIICRHLHANYGISDNTNKALELADGKYIAMFDHDDLLEPDCLYEIVNSLQDKRFDILYTDEDKINDETGQYEDPNFKPDYNPDLLLSHNYITHFFIVSRKIMQEVGGFRKEYDGSQDYDMILRCIEKSKNIHHIPKALYHWRMHKGSTAADPRSKMYCYIAGEKALNDHLKRTGINAHAQMLQKPFWGSYHIIYETPGNPLVSVVIPNCDHIDLLKACVNSLLDKNEYQNIEVIIVENNSKEDSTFKFYNEIQKEYSNVHVVKWNGNGFNFSSITNYGVSQAKGEYVLLLNNDTEVITPKAIEEMLGLCMRKDVGCVGAKLLYADNTIQHAGIVIGFYGYAGNVFTGLSNDKEYGYAIEAVSNMDYSAVTAACMMTKKSIYQQVGGLDENFKVAGNDVDYCLKVGQEGYHIAYNANALWHHYESKSRGYENSLDKIKRFDYEVTLFQKKWKKFLINGDPNYNLNFKIEDAPYQIL